MGFITAIAMIVCGILAASSLIIKKKPEAKDLIDKIVPFQGWIGIVVACWGIWSIIYCIMHIGWLAGWPIWWITYLATGVIELLLGFILGWGLFSKMALKNKPELQEKGQETLQKLASIQIPIGIIGIALGIWGIISNIIWSF